MLRGLLTLLTMIVSTTVLGLTAIVAGGLSRRPEVVMRLGKLWSRMHLATTGVHPRYDGLEHAAGRTPRIFLANHLSALDIWAIAVALPDNTRFVAKKSLFWFPVLGQAMAVAGFIPIDRKDRTRAIRSLEAAAATVRAGASLILFPEGTRSRDGKLAPFKKGAFHLALTAGVPIVPVAISGSGDVLKPRSIVVRPGTVTVTFLPPIDPGPYAAARLAELMGRVREEIARKLAPAELDEADRAALASASSPPPPARESET